MHFERARAIDPGFFDAHVQAANYWKVELTPSRTDSGTSGVEPRQMLREFNERIGLAIDNARTDADRIRSLADRALVDLRLREARRLFEQYLELRPNDELARFELAKVLGMLSERGAMRGLLEHWKAKMQRTISPPPVWSTKPTASWTLPRPPTLASRRSERWPNSIAMIYQTHRSLVWAGRYREASELAARYEASGAGGRSSGQGARGLRGRRPGIRRSRSWKSWKAKPPQISRVLWITHNMLGNTREEIEVLRPLEQSGVPFQLASFLTYTKFDPRPFPELMAILEREGVESPATGHSAVPLPAARRCPRSPCCPSST